MNHVQLVLQSFRDHTVHTLIIDGIRYWVAREIGEILGYPERGKRFANQITGEWGDDFLLGHDYRLLDGEALAQAKVAIPAIPRNAAGMLVLTEVGVHMALLRSRKPLGGKLRRFIADQVMPQLARTGEYRVSAAAPPTSAPPDTAAIREARLAARVDLDDRQFRSSELRNTAVRLHVMKKLDEATFARTLVAATELALGHPLPALYDAMDRWVRLDDVADQLRVTPAEVWTAAAALNLLADRGALSRPRAVRDGDGWKVSFEFSELGIRHLRMWFDASSPDDPEPEAQPAVDAEPAAQAA